jgi:ferredoxin
MGVYVTENCEDCRYTECVKVCPVSCFHADEKMVYVDNDTCIDCFACIPACPVQAILGEDDLTEEQQRWVEINRERSAALPVIKKAADPLPTAPAKRAALGF